MSQARTCRTSCCQERPGLQALPVSLAYLVFPANLALRGLLALLVLRAPRVLRALLVSPARRARKDRQDLPAAWDPSVQQDKSDRAASQVGV